MSMFGQINGLSQLANTPTLDLMYGSAAMQAQAYGGGGLGFCHSHGYFNGYCVICHSISLHGATPVVETPKKYKSLPNKKHIKKLLSCLPPT